MRGIIPVIFCMVLSACQTGSPDDMDQDTDSLEYERVPDNQSVDLGYITLLSGTMEGVLFDQSVDQATWIDGDSNELVTNVQLINDQTGNEHVVMGMHSFRFDVAESDDLSGERYDFGCMGAVAYQWVADMAPINSTVTVTREADLYIVGFEMDFESDEWLVGEYTFALN